MTEDIIIEDAANALKEGKTILYPTDTVWGLGGDAMREDVFEKLYEIKHRPKDKKCIVLFSSLEMVNEYLYIDQSIDFLIQPQTPTTFVLDVPSRLPQILYSDKGIAIRIPKNDFCIKMINKLGKPILSTSANISGDIAPKRYHEIAKPIRDAVDYIVPESLDTGTGKPSNVIVWQKNQFIKLR